MSKISPKEIFKNLPLFFKILIITITVIGSLLIILTIYVNLKDLQNGNNSLKTWDNESEIALKYSEKPESTISWELGCEENDTDCGDYIFSSKPNTKVIIYTQYDDFVDTLKSQIFYDPQKNDPQHEVILDFLKDLSSENSEILLDDYEKEIKDIDSANNTGYSFVFSDVKEELLEQAKVAVYDIQNNQFVEYITIEEDGSSCGSGCGEGSKEYKLPNGKIFESSGWIS
jgi:hypothetical protein